MSEIRVSNLHFFLSLKKRDFRNEIKERIGSLEEARQLLGDIVTAGFFGAFSSCRFPFIPTFVKNYLQVYEEDLFSYLYSEKERNLVQLSDYYRDANDTSRLLTPLEFAMIFWNVDSIFQLLASGEIDVNIYNCFSPFRYFLLELKEFYPETLFTKNICYPEENDSCEKYICCLDNLLEAFLYYGAKKPGDKFPLLLALEYSRRDLGTYVFAETMIFCGAVSYPELFACYLYCGEGVSYQREDVLELLSYQAEISPYTAEEVERNIGEMGRDFWEISHDPEVAEILGLDRLILDLPPDFVEKNKRYISPRALETFEVATAKIEACSGPRAAGIIFFRLSDAYFRPGGKGYYLALAHFDALRGKEAPICYGQG